MEQVNHERWRGRVDAELTKLHHWIETLASRHNKLDAKEQLLELKVQTVATKIGFYATLGAFIGGGIMSLLVALVTVFIKK